MDEITFLDLGKIELYGWETMKSDRMVDALVRGIEAGDDFPPVRVNKISDTVYWLALNHDGGHRRAAAHYIAGKPLKVVIEPLPSGLGISHPYPIKEIVLIDDRGQYEAVKRTDPNYR